jgi:hypothetical protein
MKLAGLITLAASITTLAQLPTAVPPAHDLSAKELLTIDSGRQVVREEKVRNSAWPRVSVHQFVGATPEEATAVFIDYARHSTYIPGLRKSSVSRGVAPRVTEVDYVLAVPFYADEDYTVRDSLSTDDGGLGYRVDWKMVRARSTKEIVGSARFEPYRNERTGRDGTLITYVNLVVPGQFLAGPLKGRALRQVRETVAALVRQVERERSGDPGLLASQIAVLSAALKM